MGVIVQKYGGSSLSNTERIKDVSRRVAKKIREGYKIIIVVSAMGDTTDELVELSKKISHNPDPRELDMLLTTGEQTSASLLAMAIGDCGIKVKSLTAFQAGIKTTGDFNDTKISNINSERLLDLLLDYDVLVITGFQGINEEGDFTTLGRGGSDTTAVALAALLRVPCEIYSDVTGIFSIDPKYFPFSKKRRYVCYDEMIEMASLGARVLNSRSVEIAKKFNVPIYCSSSFTDEEGSFVVSNDQLIEKPVVTGLSVMSNQTQVTIYNLPNENSIVFSIFEEVSKQNFNVDMISLIKTEANLHLSFTILSERKENLDIALRKLCENNGSHTEYNGGYAKVSVVGIGMKSSPGVATRLFKTLKPYRIQMVTTSEIKISCLIEACYVKDIVRDLVKEFDL